MTRFVNIMPHLMNTKSLCEDKPPRFEDQPPPAHAQTFHQPTEIVMSPTTNRARHTIFALKLPLSVPALITYAKGLVTRMTANPSFPNPTPALAAVTAAIDDLQVGETPA